MLTHGMPSVVVRKRRHIAHIGLTDMVEVHVDNETIRPLKEVGVWAQLFPVLPGESQDFLIVLPVLALFVEISEHFLEGCILDQLVDDNSFVTKGYHLTYKQLFEVNFQIHNSLQNICNLFWIADSVQEHLADHEPKFGDAFPNISFSFCVTHDSTLPFILTNIHPLLTGIFRVPRTGCRNSCVNFRVQLYTF